VGVDQRSGQPFLARSEFLDCRRRGYRRERDGRGNDEVRHEVQMGARDDSDDGVAAGQAAVGAEDDDGAIVEKLDRTGRDWHGLDGIRCGDVRAAQT